jgi:iron complex outermembrane receptor protein
LARYAYRGETRCNEVSGQQGSCRVTPNLEVGEAQHRTDLRLGWNSASDMYSVAAFVNNDYDERYVEGINNITTGTLGTPLTSFATRTAIRG